MERVLNAEAKKYLGKKIKVFGWVNSKRSHGEIVFLDLRDKSGILQVVCQKKLAERIKEEDVLKVEGKIEMRPREMINPKLETGEIELKAEKIEVLAKSQSLPFDLKNLKMKLTKLLNFRPLTLRNQKIQAIFKIQEGIIDSFRKTMKELGFFEFQAPIIVASATEGGAQLFPVKYFKHKAYLAQSPQLYKQILVSAFERVFCVAKAFRAEPSMTTRHLTEYISLDCEMGFIRGLDDLMDVCQTIMKNIFFDLEKNFKKELEVFDAKLPKIERIPKIKFKEAKEIFFERTKKDKRQEADLDPEEEREICNFSKEKFNSELIFVTHFPIEKRPFYTFPDPENKNYTLSFDLIFRGMEIATGGQRISDYKMLIKNMKKFGLDPKDFDYYLQAFKYGMPPEGGFALGAERITKQILNLENIKEASLFPRDMERIDLLFSALKKK